ncbi:hypothetical protein ABPG77_001092 [Micractinium sp. CCAP 211/92]
MPSCRPEVVRTFGAARFLPAEQRGDVPERYSKVPAVQAAYRLADSCLRPALLGRQLIACLMLDGQNGLEAGFKVNLDPEGLTSLAAAWESTDPLHALLARLLPWQRDSHADIVLQTASRYLALAVCLGQLAHLFDGLDAQLHVCDELLLPLRRTLDYKASPQPACTPPAGPCHGCGLNQEGCAAALLCEGLLAVKDAQLQLMWQVQRAQDINDAFLDAMRGHQHQLEAQRLQAAQTAGAGNGPGHRALSGPLPPPQELAEARRKESRQAEECLDAAEDALRRTRMGCKNWVATEVSRPRDSGGPGWPQRRLLESLDQLQRLHDRALAVGEAQAAGEGGADSASPTSTQPRPGFDDLSSDEEWLLSSLDSWGRARRPTSLDDRLERGMFECLDALRDLWHSGRFLQLRCGLCDRREELRATQAEAHRAACLLLRLLPQQLGCVVCPADSLARCMLAHLLPERWGEAVKQAEAQQREAAWRELMATEDQAAAAAKKKKKKAKKGGGQAAAPAAQSAASTAAASDKDDDDVNEGAWAGGEPGDEDEEGYQRMLREYEEAQPWTPEPCRAYLKSGCPYGRTCRFSHPQFALDPPEPPPPGRRTTLVNNPKALSAAMGTKATEDWRVRVVSWIGEWVCPCGDRHFMQHPCSACGYPSPCRDWLRGSCKYGTTCQYPHPPFDLPSGPPPPAAPPAAVAALAESLGVPAEGLAELLPPEDLAAALETVQLRAIDQEGQQAQQVQLGQGQALHDARHEHPATQPEPPVAPAALSTAPRGVDLASGRAGAAAAEPAGEAAGHSGMRVVGGDGSWVCGCGRLNPISREHKKGSKRGTKLLSRCGGCPQAGPCRQWLLGKCTAVDCPYPHPPFDEACWAPAPSGTQPRAALWEGAPRYVHTLPATQQQQQQQEQQHGYSAPITGMAVAASLGLGGEDDLDELLQVMGVSASGPAQVAAAPPPSCDVATPGLRNETGEYNCFLNVIIQCLWRCADFRRQVMAWGPDVCAHDPVFAALHSLFHAFAAEEAQRRAGGPLTGTAARRGLIDPSELRQALSVTSGEQFRAGEMNDAGEVLLTLYERTIRTGAAAEDAVNAIFGLSVEEQVKCARCGKATHCSSYTQFFCNVQAAALQQAFGTTASRRSMGQLFRQLEMQLQKSCDRDLGGCGAKNCVSCSLTSAPRVFTVQLAWESHREEAHSVAATLANIDEQVDLADVYLGVEPGSKLYRLNSMVCYYGQHYSAFVWADDLGAWLMFDDAAVSRVGAWADVRCKCEAGRIQPSVLFYEAVK